MVDVTHTKTITKFILHSIIILEILPILFGEQPPCHIQETMYVARAS